MRCGGGPGTRSNAMKPRILVVDVDKSTRTALRAILESAEYEVVEAADSETGMAVYRENPPDLVVLDIVMPEKDGSRAINQLKTDYPDARIFAISGSGIGYLMMAEEYGAMRTFIKPLNPNEVLQAVKELLEK